MDISAYFDQSWVGLKYKILSPAYQNFNRLAEIVEDDGTSIAVKFPSGNVVSFNKSRFSEDVNHGAHPPDLAFGPGMPGWVERPVPEDVARILSGHGDTIRWENPTEEMLKVKDEQGEIRPPMIGKKTTAQEPPGLMPVPPDVYNQSWVGMRYKIISPRASAESRGTEPEIVADDGVGIVIRFANGNHVVFKKEGFFDEVVAKNQVQLTWGPGIEGWVPRPVEPLQVLPTAYGQDVDPSDIRGGVRPPMIGKKTTAQELSGWTFTPGTFPKYEKRIGDYFLTIRQDGPTWVNWFLRGIEVDLIAHGIAASVELAQEEILHALDEARGFVERDESTPFPPLFGKTAQVPPAVPFLGEGWVYFPETEEVFASYDKKVSGGYILQVIVYPPEPGDSGGFGWSLIKKMHGAVPDDHVAEGVSSSLEEARDAVVDAYVHPAHRRMRPASPSPRRVRDEQGEMFPPMIGARKTAQAQQYRWEWWSAPTGVGWQLRDKQNENDERATITKIRDTYTLKVWNVGDYQVLLSGETPNAESAMSEVYRELGIRQVDVNPEGVPVTVEDDTPRPPMLGKTAQTYERMMPDRKDYWNPAYPTPRKRPNTKTDDADLFSPIVETDTEDTPVGTGMAGPTVNPGGEVPGTAESDHYERTPGETRVVRKGGSPPRGMAPFLQECLDEMGVNYRVSDFDWALQENYSLQRFLQISGSTKAAWVSLYKKHPAPESGAIWVVEFDGEIEVIDGNHRIGEALSKGKESIPAYVGVLKSVRKAQVTNWLGQVYYLNNAPGEVKQVISIEEPTESGIVFCRVRHLDGREEFTSRIKLLNRLLREGELTLVDKDVPLPETPPFPPMLGSVREGQRGYAWYNVANGRAWHLRGPGTDHNFAEIFKRSEEHGGGYHADVWDVRDENFDITSEGEFPNLSQAMDWAVRVSKEEGHIPTGAVVRDRPFHDEEPPEEVLPHPPMIGSLHKAQLELFAQTPKKYVWEELHSGSPHRFWRLDLPGEYDSVAEVVPVYGGESRVAEWDAQVWHPRTLDGSPRNVKLVSQKFPLNDVAGAMQWCVENAKAQGVLPQDAEIGGYEPPPRPPMVGSLREAQLELFAQTPKKYVWEEVLPGVGRRTFWRLIRPGSTDSVAEIIPKQDTGTREWEAQVWRPDYIGEHAKLATQRFDLNSTEAAMRWCIENAKAQRVLPQDADIGSYELSPRPPMLGKMVKAQHPIQIIPGWERSPKAPGRSKGWTRVISPGAEWPDALQLVIAYWEDAPIHYHWALRCDAHRRTYGYGESETLQEAREDINKLLKEVTRGRVFLDTTEPIYTKEGLPRPPMTGKRTEAQHLPGGVSIEDIEEEIDAGWVPRAGARLQQDLNIMVGERPYHAEAVFEVRTDHWHARVDLPGGEWTGGTFGGTFAGRDAAEDFCRDEILNAIRVDFGIEPVPRPVEEPSPRPPMLGKRTAQIPRGFMWLSSGVRDSWVLRDTTEFESDWRVTVMPERETGGFRWTVYKKNSADVQAKGEASDLDQATQRVYTILGISEADLVTGVRPGKPELIRDEQGEVRPPMIGSLKTATIGEWIQVEAGEKYAMSGRHHTAWVKKITERGWAWKVSNHSTPSSSARILASGSEETMGAALFKAQEALVRLENAEPAPFPPMLGKKTTAQNPPRRIPSMTDNLVGLVYRNNLLGVEYIVTADGVVSGRPTVYMKVFHTEGEQAPGLGVPEHKETFIKGFEGTSPARSVVRMPQEATPPASEPPPRPPMIGKKVEAQVRRWEDMGVNSYVLQGKNDHAAFLYTTPDYTPSAKVLYLPRNINFQKLLWQGTDPREGGAYLLAKAAEDFMKAHDMLEPDALVDPSELLAPPEIPEPTPEPPPRPPMLGKKTTAQEAVWEYPIQEVFPSDLQTSANTGAWVAVDVLEGINAEVLSSRDGTKVAAIWDGPYEGKLAMETWRHTDAEFIPWYANTHMAGSREEAKHAVETWVGVNRTGTPADQPRPPLFGKKVEAQAFTWTPSESGTFSVCSSWSGFYAVVSMNSAGWYWYVNRTGYSGVVMTGDRLASEPAAKAAAEQALRRVVGGGTFYPDPHPELPHPPLFGKKVNARMAIPATMSSDDGEREAKFDASWWFERASEEDIKELRDIGWGGDYAADEVARWYESKNEDVFKVFHYCNAVEEGFEVHIDPEAAEAWVRENQPHIADGPRPPMVGKTHTVPSDEARQYAVLGVTPS